VQPLLPTSTHALLDETKEKRDASQIQDAFLDAPYDEQLAKVCHLGTIWLLVDERVALTNCLAFFRKHKYVLTSDMTNMVEASNEDNDNEADATASWMQEERR